MKSLFQRNWYTQVRRFTPTLLQAGTSYVDTCREAAVRLLVDTQTFMIKEALVEEQRSAVPMGVRTRHIPVLEGKEAYFSSGPALKEAAVFLQDSLLVALLSETVKGMIQSETFLLEERGYGSEQEYNNYWKETYNGSCRFYSNLDRVTQSWYEHVGESKREGNLFLRFKTQSLFELGEGRYLLTGNLSDSFHEVTLSLELKGTKVVQAHGKLLRTPDLVCREAAALLENLHGVDLKGLAKKQIASLLGSSQGCVHVIDLVTDCVQALELARW